MMWSEQDGFLHVSQPSDGKQWMQVNKSGYQRPWKAMRTRQLCLFEIFQLVLALDFDQQLQEHSQSLLGGSNNKAKTKSLCQNGFQCLIFYQRLRL